MGERRSRKESSLKNKGHNISVGLPAENSALLPLSDSLDMLPGTTLAEKVESRKLFIDRAVESLNVWFWHPCRLHPMPTPPFTSIS